MFLLFWTGEKKNTEDLAKIIKRTSITWLEENDYNSYQLHIEDIAISNTTTF